MCFSSGFASASVFFSLLNVFIENVIDAMCLKTIIYL